jgi:hypothetical protein
MKRYLLLLLVALGCASVPIQSKTPSYAEIRVTNFRPEPVSIWVFQDDQMRLLGNLSAKSAAIYKLTEEDIADIVRERTKRVGKYLTTETFDSTKSLVLGVHTEKTDHYFVFDEIKVSYDCLILVVVQNNIGASNAIVYKTN